MKIRLCSKTHVVLLALLFLTSAVSFGDAPNVAIPGSKRVIQDPKTKVIYYLESDLRHIAALSPEGKLLWCCEVIPPTMERRVCILGFSFSTKDENMIFVVSNNIGPTYGNIDKKSGVYTFWGAD
jgi:hypothetical protein